MLSLRYSAKGALPLSASAASTASVPSLSCSIDGAPWYSPDKWCSCSGKKYATIATATSAPALYRREDFNQAECAYSILPTSTINPISVSSAPTNVPGMNGLSGCAAVAAGDEQGCPGVDYCNCNNVYVGFLAATVNGSVSSNCDYSIQPTANDCPVNTAALASASATAGDPGSPPSAPNPSPPPSTGCNFPCCTQVSDCTGTCAKGWVCSPAGSGQSTG